MRAVHAQSSRGRISAARERKEDGTKAARNSTLRLTVLMLVGVIAAAQQPKPRVVITADPELDDNNTLIRAILYSSDFQIEGLVYASSTFHWKGDDKGKHNTSLDVNTPVSACARAHHGAGRQTSTSLITSSTLTQKSMRI